MKKIYFSIILLLAGVYSYAQPIDSVTDKGLKDQVLKDISERFQQNNEKLEVTVTSLNKKIENLNQQILDSKNANEKALRLQERINAIEDKQAAMERAETNVYQANYQSAVINLVSMEREIKPLVLFNTTKSFFSSLEDASNPNNYAGYKEWYKGFQDYMENNKKSDPILSVTSTLLTLTGNLTGLSKITGTVTNALFSSMSSYIGNTSKKKKDLRETSEKMFALTMKLAQFKSDQQAIESEWDKISKELLELQKHYEKIKKENFVLLKIQPNEFSDRFTNESDANKRFQYMNDLTQKTASTIENMKEASQKDWKADVYHEMMDIQALKIRFGNVTFRVKDNINRYNELFKLYKNDPDLGPKVLMLEGKVKDLAATFDDTFNPIEYVNSATRMYKVL